tara:strand:+ start:7856 stop:8575 length:720 start_codon:yes stop_codon:yes gene_type:complete
MEILQVILWIIVVILIIWIIRYFTKSNSNSLTGIEDAGKAQTISAADLPSDSQTSNYTYSTWFYVQDWSYRFGEEKTLLSRGRFLPSPSIVLGAMENNITVSVTCYPTSSTSSSGSSSGAGVLHKCELANFPLQKWVNLIISLNGQTMDVYIDGKLSRTCVLPGPAMSNPDADVEITPGGGFNGYTANFQYRDSPVNPQQAYNIYKRGFGGSSLGNMFEKYKVRVQFLEDNHVEAQFQI